MKRLIPLLIIFICLSACTKDKPIENPTDSSLPIVVNPPVGYTVRDSIQVSLKEFSIPGTTIRALEVLNDSEVWFAGSNGKWGYTTDNGNIWTINELIHQGIKPNFRSITVNPNGDVFLVSVENPAAIFKSNDNGLNWNVEYKDIHPDAFFDAIEFWNNNDGIIMGDPLNNCFHIAITHDGGDTWTKVDCGDLPAATQNEYPFAASNTNIALSGTQAWFATGGKDDARVFHTPDLGKTWEVVTTPIISGKEMTGIYSIDFNNEQSGIIAGGDWDNIANSNKIAITNDG